MNAQNVSTTPVRRGWLRKLIWLVAILVVLLVVAFFVISSGAFLKGVVLPRVGNSMNAKLTAGEVAFSPFSRLELRDVKLTPNGQEPVFTASLVRARYNLLSIIGGKITVDELTVESPVISILANADGTCNLDPLLKQETEAKKESAPAKPVKPLQIDVKSVSLKNAMFRQITSLKDGGRQSVELSDLNFNLTDLRNGATGKLGLSAVVAAENTAPENAGTLRGKLTADYTFDLTADLMPARLNGSGGFTIEAATGKLADFNAVKASLDCEATPTEVKQIALRFTRSGEPLSELRASGPFDAAKTEGKLNVAVLSLDRRVLNMFGAASGLDFGTTVINSTNVVELTKGGSHITASGQLQGANVRITREGQTTPTLDLACNYAVTVDNAAQSAVLRSFNLLGAQNGQPLLRGGLTSPMTLAFGESANGTGDAALDLAVTSLNLADWKPFTGEAARAGVANAKLKLVSQKGGQQLTFDLASSVDKLSARFGSNEIIQADVRLTARGSATDLKQFKLDEYRFELAEQGQNALALSGSGNFDSVTQDADLQVTVRAVITRLLAVLPQPGATVSSGTLDFKGHITSKDKNQTVTGELALADFDGNYGEYRFTSFGASVNCDVAMKSNALEIRRAVGQLREAQNLGGNFDVTGNLDLERKSGQFTLKLTDFNQNALRPFLAPALADKKLVSVALNTTASVTLAGGGDGAIKADLQVANLVVNDPKGTVPGTPLEARAQVDASVVKQVAQLRQCQLTLTPTDRAKNQISLTGSVDFSRSNAITGNLKLAAESLDVTRYYDLFAGKSTTAGTGAGAVSTPTAPPSDPNKEPDAVKLPFSNFAFDANVGRFYLREMDIASLQTTAKLDGGKALLKPCQLSLNGAPVNATVDLDLGVPGYKYDVAFNASAVPLAPLVNTFAPERKGQMAGTTTANAQIKGAGVTGASLQKNLSGQFSFMSTNMNLSIANVRSPLINSVINVIVGIPDLIRNPAGAVGNLIAGLAGSGGTRGGWADQLTAAPIDVILANGKAGDGRVTLDQAEVRSSAFLASANGDIILDSILTNSAIRIPVNVSLSRSLGEKIGLVSANTPTNATYVPMPQFLTMKGTVGKPKHDINELALVALAAKAGGGIGKNLGGATGEKVEGVLGIVGGILGGNQPTPATTNAPATGATQSNVQPANVQPANPVNDILNLFKKPKK